MYVHSSRIEKSRTAILNWKVFTQGFRGSWLGQDGRQLARLGSFSYRWQPVPGEIFYLKKGMEIFLFPRTRKNKFVGRSPPTARYFLVFRPTLPGDLVTWWNKEWRMQGTFEDFQSKGRADLPPNWSLRITWNFCLAIRKLWNVLGIPRYSMSFIY